jgi:hypothetical protein
MTTFTFSEIPEEQKIKALKYRQILEEAPYHPGYESASSEDIIKTSIAGYQDMVKASQTATSGGRKFDGGKPQYGLLPPNALRATVDILTFGAEKYEPNNWKHVPDSKRRYFDAAQRHLWDWKNGEQNDPESGKNHLAHALCCLMFLYEHDTIYSVDKT